MDVSVEEFFEDNFVANVAFVLNIDPARIRVVSIVGGSVKVDFEIEPDPATLTVPDEDEEESGSGGG
eukprot:CAMPEP_0203824008 /NCGR_PEP_ID=MMETSP0115-20131106/50714_1 /ASSEMBLY_ACC=CAM_ASM_000227 /TAXON_ID=33651 /ORGANISM="Bicosoecid sp, Strain ms1" /LENGTH=66 /DNA_ID=CAMNT_0050733043 /DNA_START=33 /DNA_END=229 /DNA_ORIENTATION=+